MLPGIIQIAEKNWARSTFNFLILAKTEFPHGATARISPIVVFPRSSFLPHDHHRDYYACLLLYY